MANVVECESAHERDLRRAFLCMMNALSRPGSPVELPAQPGTDIFDRMILLGRALLDLERSFYTSNPALEEALRETGAWSTTLDRADYVFIDAMDADDLDGLACVRVGELAYPDYGATLFIGCEIDAADAPLRSWRGPGIPGEQVVQIGGVPRAFWALRDRLIRYPLGVDVFFVGASELIGLPRTTRVAPCM